MAITLLSPAAAPTATQTGKPASAAAESANALKTAATATSQAEDALKQIGQLQAFGQTPDTFTLQKLQALAETALSETNGIGSAGEQAVQASTANAGYLAQAALQKIAQLQSLAVGPDATKQADGQLLNTVA